MSLCWQCSQSCSFSTLVTSFMQGGTPDLAYMKGYPHLEPLVTWNFCCCVDYPPDWGSGLVQSALFLTGEEFLVVSATRKVIGSTIVPLMTWSHLKLKAHVCLCMSSYDCLAYRFFFLEEKVRSLNNYNMEKSVLYKSRGVSWPEEEKTPKGPEGIRTASLLLLFWNLLSALTKLWRS